MKHFSVQHYMFRPLANEEGLFPVLSEIAVTDYIVKQAEFDVSIRESLRRNAEFMKRL